MAGKYDKLNRLLRYHRANVFDADESKADRHERALKRLKKTKTYIALCAENSARADEARSNRLLSLYA